MEKYKHDIKCALLTGVLIGAIAGSIIVLSILELYK